MKKDATLLTKAISVSATTLVVVVLSACSSGGDSGSDNGSGSNIDAGQQAANTPLQGDWELCSEVGGLRVEYSFTATTFTNSVGGGNCSGFSDADGVLTTSGPYEISGTTTADSGVEANVMELTTQTFNGAQVLESVSVTRTRLAHIDETGQLFFSDDASAGQELSLTINFSSPYVRSR